MSSSCADAPPRALDLQVTDDDLVLDLEDGRRLYVPLSWFPRLHRASPQQRKNWRFIGDGEGSHWAEIDEDLSVRDLLEGYPAPGGVTRPRDRSQLPSRSHEAIAVRNDQANESWCESTLC